MTSRECLDSVLRGTLARGGAGGRPDISGTDAALQYQDICSKYVTLCAGASRMYIVARNRSKVRCSGHFVFTEVRSGDLGSFEKASGH